MRAAPSHSTDRTHLARLGAIGGVAALIRVVVTVTVTQNAALGAGDGFFYSATGNLIGDGRGYVDPLVAATGANLPTANLPPGWPGVLGAFSWIGIDTQLGHRLIGAVLGGVAAIAIGVLATHLSNRRAGLIAAGIVAVNPGLITADGSLHAETLYGIFAVAAIIVAARGAAREQRRWSDAVALGVIVGFAALVRGDILMLAPFLAFAAASPKGSIGVTDGGTRQPSRILHMGLAGIVAVMVIAPWTIRNYVQLDGAVLVSTNEATLIAGSNCDATYGGELIGSWTFSCLPPIPGKSEAERSAVLRDTGITYAREHRDRLPVVLVARQGRTWGFWAPFEDASPGRNSTLAAVGTIFWWMVLLPGTFLGLRELRRRGVGLLAPAAPFISAVIISVIGYGTPRFRYVPELVAAALAAIAVDAWLTRRTGKPLDRAASTIEA